MSFFTKKFVGICCLGWISAFHLVYSPNLTKVTKTPGYEGVGGSARSEAKQQSGREVRGLAALK